MAYDLEFRKDPADGKFWRDKPLEWLASNEPDASDARFLLDRFPKLFQEVPYTSYSRQYDAGGPPNESNARVWAEQFALGEDEDDADRWWWGFGGDTDILIATELAPEEAFEVIDRLDGYPIIDEGDWSELEWEIQAENWKDYGRSDAKRAIVEAANAAGDANGEVVEELLDAVSDKDFDSVYWEDMNDGGSYPEQDGGGYGTIFPVSSIAVPPLWFDDLAVWLGLNPNEARVLIGDVELPEPWAVLAATEGFQLDFLREILREVGEVNKFSGSSTPKEAERILDQLTVWREAFCEVAAASDNPMQMLVCNLVRETEDLLREAAFEPYEDEEHGRKRLRLRGPGWPNQARSVLGNEVPIVLRMLLGESITDPAEQRMLGRLLAQGQTEGGWGKRRRALGVEDRPHPQGVQEAATRQEARELTYDQAYNLHIRSLDDDDAARVWADFLMERGAIEPEGTEADILWRARTWGTPLAGAEAFSRGLYALHSWVRYLPIASRAARVAGAIACARSVSHLILNQTIGLRAIEAAERWLRDPSEQNVVAATAAANAANSAARAAVYSDAAAAAAASAVAKAAAAAYYAADAAYYAADAAATAATAAVYSAASPYVPGGVASAVAWTFARAVILFTIAPDRLYAEWDSQPPPSPPTQGAKENPHYAEGRSKQDFSKGSLEIEALWSKRIDLGPYRGSDRDGEGWRVYAEPMWDGDWWIQVRNGGDYPNGYAVSSDRASDFKHIPSITEALNAWLSSGPADQIPNMAVIADSIPRLEAIADKSKTSRINTAVRGELQQIMQGLAVWIEVFNEGWLRRMYPARAHGMIFYHVGTAYRDTLYAARDSDKKWRERVRKAARYLKDAIKGAEELSAELQMDPQPYAREAHETPAHYAAAPLPGEQPLDGIDGFLPELGAIERELKEISHIGYTPYAFTNEGFPSAGSEEAIAAALAALPERFTLRREYEEVEVEVTAGPWNFIAGNGEVQLVVQRAGSTKDYARGSYTDLLNDLKPVEGFPFPLADRVEAIAERIRTIADVIHDFLADRGRVYEKARPGAKWGILQSALHPLREAVTRLKDFRIARYNRTHSILEARDGIVEAARSIEDKDDGALWTSPKLLPPRMAEEPVMAEEPGDPTTRESWRALFAQVVADLRECRVKVGTKVEDNVKEWFEATIPVVEVFTDWALERNLDIQLARMTRGGLNYEVILTDEQEAQRGHKPGRDPKMVYGERDLIAALAIAKHGYVIYDVFSLDVWGNAEDGFEVNNRFRLNTPIGGDITIDPLPSTATDEEIIERLIDADYLEARARGEGGSPAVEVDAPGDGDFLEINSAEDGMPIFQLERQETLNQIELAAQEIESVVEVWEVEGDLLIEALHELRRRRDLERGGLRDET